MDAVENNDKSYFDPILAPQDQVERYMKANYPDHVKNAIETLVVDYQIKLRVILDKLDNHEITSELINDINDAKLLNVKHYKIYEDLNISPKYVSLKGLEAIEKHKAAIRDMNEIINGSHESKYTENNSTTFQSLESDPDLMPTSNNIKFEKITKDDSVVNSDYESTISEVKSDYFPEDNQEHNYRIFNSDQDLTPDRVSEFVSETRKNSVSPNKKRKYKKARKKIDTNTIRKLLLLLSLVTVLTSSGLGIKSHYDKVALENAKKVYDATHEYVQFLNDNGKKTPDDYLEHIKEFDEDSQLNELEKIGIGEIDTSFDSLENPTDLANNPEAIKIMDIIKEKDVAAKGVIRDKMREENNGDEVMGLWREKEYQKLVKDTKRKG